MCAESIKTTSYVTLVRPKLEYTSVGRYQHLNATLSNWKECKEQQPIFIQAIMTGCHAHVHARKTSQNCTLCLVDIELKGFLNF